MKYQFLFLFTILLTLIGCSQKSGWPASSLASRNILPITILHTNDIHGHAWEKKNKKGKLVGGYAIQSEMINAIRKEVSQKKGISIVLSGGDVNTGVPESDLLKGKPDIEAMNHIGYDAMVLGNHEMDRGFSQLKEQMKWAKFPIISANVTIDKKHNIKLNPFSIIEKNNIKFCILGLTTTDIKTIVLQKHAKILKVLNPIATAKHYSKIFKGKNCNIPIALTHLGYYEDGGILIGDRELANGTEYYPLIVGGHSHTELAFGELVNKSLVTQAYGHGKFLGRIDILWDIDNKVLLKSRAKLIPIIEDYGIDKTLQARLNNYKKLAGKKLLRVIGHSSLELEGERKLVRSQETNLGNLICDALKTKAKTDVAVFHGGGIRSTIDKGPIKIRDVYEVLPFGNTMVTMTLSGKQLKQVIEVGLRYRKTTGSFLQVSGLKYTFKNDKLSWASVRGRKIKNNKKYTLATNNYIAEGGDHFKIFLKSKNRKDSRTPVAQVLINYLGKIKKVRTKKEGRITQRE